MRFVSFLRGKPCNCLDGKYKLELPNQGIRLTLDNGLATISGCNQFSFKFNLADNGALVFGAVTAT